MDLKLKLPLQKNDSHVIGCIKVTEIRIIGKKGIIKKFKTVKGFNRYINRECERVDGITKVKLEWRGLQMF